MGPVQPVARRLIAADHSQAEQVVQPAAVNANREHIAALDQFGKFQRGLHRLPLPPLRAGPPVRPERQADLDVQVLRQEAPHAVLADLLGLRELACQELLVYRGAQVRVRDVELCRVTVFARVQHRLRKFVQHRLELRVLDPPLAYTARVLQLLSKHARRWLVRLRAQQDDAPLWPASQAARGLAQHVLGVRPLAEQPQLVDQRDDPLLAGHRLAVGCNHLQRGFRGPVRDRADVVLHMQKRRQLLVGLDRIRRRLEGVVRDFDGRGQDAELASLTPVQDQKGQHQQACRRALGVLLADQQQPLTDEPAAAVRVVGAEHRGHKLANPGPTDLAEGRAAGHVDHPQLVHHGQRGGRFGREQRPVADQPTPLDNAALPVG